MFAQELIDRFYISPAYKLDRAFVRSFSFDDAEHPAKVVCWLFGAVPGALK
jgi:hypothetical protein